MDFCQLTHGEGQRYTSACKTRFETAAVARPYGLAACVADILDLTVAAGGTTSQRKSTPTGKRDNPSFLSTFLHRTRPP
ncbi:MAG: hypothetical protein ACI83N_001893 [Hydrogenophaga sp.]|jgi:hypothetical protein